MPRETTGKRGRTHAQGKREKSVRTVFDEDEWQRFERAKGVSRLRELSTGHLVRIVLLEWADSVWAKKEGK